MPVNTQHKEYQDNLHQWAIVRDCVTGQIAVQKGGELYLPRPAGQTREDYENYQARAVFFDGTSRTAEGLFGHVFTKDPAQTGADKISDAFKLMLDDVDASGTNLDEFVSNITWDAMQAPWGGILVDHSPVPDGTSVADNKRFAYLKWYSAEAVYNWRYSFIDGINKLAKVILREDIETEDPADEFSTITTEAYRVLSFDENNRYIQRLFVKEDGAEKGFVLAETIYPRMNGEYLDFIPFYTCPGEIPEKSMLLGLAFENIGHYQKTAEYENGLFLTSVPTPIAENMEPPTIEKEREYIENGIKKTKKEKTPVTMVMGGSKFKFFCQKNSDGSIAAVNVKFLEFSGAGLGQLLSALNGCLDRMAKLGIQAIGAEKKGVETAEVAQIHRASEHGVLGAFARAMSNKITLAVKLMAQWNLPNEDADVWSYQLNTDYNYSELSAQILSIMYTARQSDEIPRSVWFDSLKKNEMVPENMTFDEFLKGIEADATGGHGPDGNA